MHRFNNSSTLFDRSYVPTGTWRPSRQSFGLQGTVLCVRWTAGDGLSEHSSGLKRHVTRARTARLYSRSIASRRCEMIYMEAIPRKVKTFAMSEVRLSYYRTVNDLRSIANILLIGTSSTPCNHSLASRRLRALLKSKSASLSRCAGPFLLLPCVVIQSCVLLRKPPWQSQSVREFGKSRRFTTNSLES